MEWTMDVVLAHLQIRLPGEQHALIATLSAATSLPALEQFPAWRDATPQSIERVFEDSAVMRR